MTAGILSLLMRGAKPQPAAVLHELDYVELIDDAHWESKSIPKGARGTIVDWVDASSYCEVEFVEPFPCVLTLEKNKLRKANDAPLYSRS
jgi:hypothetical protein